MELLRFARFMYQPVLPMGKGGKLLTGSDAHWALAKEACTEGTALLKNDGTLPLKKGEKICLFGTGAGDFQFGGGGSGKVYAEKLISLSDALLDLHQKGEISYFTPLRDFYLGEVNKIYDEAKALYPTEREFAAWQRKFKMPLFDLPSSLYDEAKRFGGTAVFCLSRYSSEGDKDGDRPGGKGDFDLWDNEKELLDRICRDFEKVVVILNTCGPVSTREYKNCEKIGAVLYPLYGGGMAGESLAEILMGKAYPSGHLQDTLAEKLEDYPGSDTFHESPYFVNYTEDIFVGYRYFETFAPEKVSYPFGFGLGYTTFSITPEQTKYKGFRVSTKIRVKNTGKFPGKEVVQLYLSAPQGKLGKAAKVLAAWEKTRELMPGEECVLSISFSLKDFASFDDLGKIQKCAFILEEGEYTVLIGNNVRDTAPCLTFALPRNVICQVCNEYMAPRELKERLTASGKLEKLPKAKKSTFKPKVTGLLAKAPNEIFSLDKAIQEDRLEEFLATLTDEELGEMLYGHEMMNASSTNAIGLMPRYYLDDKKLIPMLPTADGPMGIRARYGRGLSATYFPGETCVSQSWNLKLAEKVGKTIALEAKECNLAIWLAPAMNIHRHPRCGRNFEYFSEDPLTTGLFAASYVKGVQSQKIAATVKHFCCNNREYNRREADSRVSMRALREIYLKGFEIAIKKANPWALMTCYNPINGAQGSTNAEGIGGILREEWGYEGIVMTDWRTYSLLEDEVKAGGDVKMPQVVSTVWDKAPKTADPAQMIKKGIIPRDMAIDAARRILTVMSHLD